MASDMVPRSGMSCRITTLHSVKYAVGPKGRWLTMSPTVGYRLSDTLPREQPQLPSPVAGLTRCASVLMDNQQVGDPIGFASPHQCSNLMPTAVHALGTWEHQFQFLP